MFFLALLFTAELIILSVWLDTRSLPAAGNLLPLIESEGAWILRCVVGFSALFLTFAYLKNRAALQQVSAEIEQLPVQWGFLAGHFAAMAAFVGLSALLFGANLPLSITDLVAASWLGVGVAAIALAAVTFLPLKLWIRIAATPRRLWAYSLVAVLGANFVADASRSLWESTAHLTFSLSKAFLSLFVSDIIADPDRLRLGTPRFKVIIDEACSGWEGAGLILAFGVIWLWVFRKECRFPQALVLLPAGVLLIFLLNSVRIAVLILIGDAGARQIAVGGFHSQAGWIAFNAVALGFAVAARRVSWLTRVAPDRHAESPANPTAVYLLPFLAILAAGMLSQAATASFEWLYPSRFLAAAAIFWIFRRQYAKLDWRCGWSGFAIGALVFLLWIGLDRFSGTFSDGAMPSALAAATVATQVAWLALRTLTAVVAVPIAEELAFRGFLLRRVLSSDFESVSPRAFSWLALAASSLAFGLLHGDRWLAGTLAGILYGVAVIRTGRIGEAIGAHAATNALLVAYILAFQKWHLW